MPEDRLFVKIVMPKQGAEKRKPAGGGEIKPFCVVTAGMRERLLQSLSEAEAILENSTLQRPVVPLRAVLNSKALAKSHWSDALFDYSSCPVMGAGKPGEVFLRATKPGIRSLKRRIQNPSSKQLQKEISALKELRPVQPQDRLGGDSAVTLFEAASTASHGRKAIKVKLFDFGDVDVQRAQVAEFERELQTREMSGLRHPQYRGQDVYTVTCRTPREVALLSHLVGVRSIGLIPMFRTLKESRFNSRPAPPDLSFPEIDPSTCPIVGVVDSGVISNVPELEPWVFGRERFVSKAEENTYHGTFVAGLITFGHVLNSSHPEIGSHPCRILDVHVLPNSDPTYGAVGSITEAELLQDLERALLKYANDVKVWNLSLGSDEICRLDRFSDFAVQLDNLQHRFGVTFVIACGNYQHAPLLPFPRDEAHAEIGRITSPADSVLGITVGSICQFDHPATGAKKGEPSPFSRHGPGPNHIIKPDLVHFGGNIGTDFAHPLGVTSLDNGPHLVEDIGTSFATPLISRQLAWIHHRITPSPSPTLARAILTHNALDVRTKARVSDGDDKYVGFGTPLGLEGALECQPWAMTLVFEETLRPGYFLEWDNFPYPESLVSNGKFKGEIWMTLAYAPARNPSYGSEYCETHVSAHFGVYRMNKEGREEFEGKVPAEHTNRGMLYESFQVKSLRKWAPVRTYHAIFGERGISGLRWRLYLELLCRHQVEQTVASSQPFALLLTIADPAREAPVYDEMVRNLRSRFQTQNLELRSGVRIQTHR